MRFERIGIVVISFSRMHCRPPRLTKLLRRCFRSSNAPRELPPISKYQKILEVNRVKAARFLGRYTIVCFSNLNVESHQRKCHRTNKSMAIVKPARIGINKPWHQDNAYFALQNLDDVRGTWIALDDSTIENGCMRFIPGGHKTGPVRHHHTYDCEIVLGRIDPSEAVAVELKAGGIILFHGISPILRRRIDQNTVVTQFNTITRKEPARPYRKRRTTTFFGKLMALPHLARQPRSSASSSTLCRRLSHKYIRLLGKRTVGSIT